MARIRKTKEILWTAAIFILLEFAAFAILRTSESVQSLWINKAAYSVKAWLWSKSDSVHDYFHLKEKNAALEEENAALWEELRRYKELESRGQVAKLDSLDTRFKCELAQIIKLSVNSQRNYFVLDKGSLDGVRPHCGVVSPDGVVGTIESVTEHLSYGRTLMNAGTSVSTRLGRKGPTGSLSWDGVGSKGAVLHGIPLYYEVNLKDTVWTSGYSNIFPAALALGTVKEVSTKNGSTKDVKVELFQDFAALDYVYILIYQYLDEMEGIEEKEVMP
ncbi:MAG: rod shape-determining protein MreC [Candidatus Cryptobacteroides sp.]